VVFVHDFRDVDLWCEVSVENVKPYIHTHTQEKLLHFYHHYRSLTVLLLSLSPPPKAVIA
jgi:hypothetical protein